MRVAFFTAGTIGAGHLVRGLAIERALRRAGARAEYAIFAPPVPYALGAALPAGLVRAVRVDHEELVDPARADASDLARALRTYAPDVLLVDLFWAPLLHVLPLPGCEAWLLVRHAPAYWLTGPPEHPFDPARFARVIAIEPGAANAATRESIEPGVVVNPDEARPASALRDAFGVAPGDRLAVACQVGAPGEWAHVIDPVDPVVHVLTFARADTPAPRTLPPNVRLHDGASFFPIAAWLGGADAIVLGAGYNAYWESRWLGYAVRTRFVPFVRPIDDQYARLRDGRAHTPRANGADVLVASLR
jgi:hypothetical protein